MLLEVKKNRRDADYVEFSRALGLGERVEVSEKPQERQFYLDEVPSCLINYFEFRV